METPPKDSAPAPAKPEKTPEQSAKAERAARLAAALRANLKRRKAPGAAGRSSRDSN